MANFPDFNRVGRTVILLVHLIRTHRSQCRCQEKKKAFGVVPVQLANPFFAEIERGAKEQANKLGVECIYTASKTANEAEQIQVFRDLITRGVNGIAIAPINGGALVGPISEARKRGIAVVMMNGDSPNSDRQDGTHSTLNVNDRWMNTLSRR